MLDVHHSTTSERPQVHVKSSPVPRSGALQWLTQRLRGPVEVLSDWYFVVRHNQLSRLAIYIFSAAVIGAFFWAIIEDESLERAAFEDGLYWALVTMTTTGYGDLTPKSNVGRIIAVALMFVGTALVSVFTAIISSILVTERIKEARGLEHLRLSGHTIICGWNNNAERVIGGLIRNSTDQRARIVLVNVLSEEAAQNVLFKYRKIDVKYISGDYTSEVVLERANVRQATSAIILADTSHGTAAMTDERTILAALAIKSVNPSIKLVAELLDEHNAAHMRRANADDIVISGEYSGYLLSAAAVAPGLPQVVRELLTIGTPTEMRRVPIPRELVGKRLAQLAAHLRQNNGSLLIGIITEDKGVSITDILTDDYSSIDEFIRRKFSEAGKGHLTSKLGSVRVIVNPSDDYEINDSDSAVVLSRERVAG